MTQMLFGLITGSGMFAKPKSSSLQGIIKQYPTLIVNPTKDKVALAWVNSENLQKEQVKKV